MTTKHARTADAPTPPEPGTPPPAHTPEATGPQTPGWSNYFAVTADEGSTPSPVAPVLAALSPATVVLGSASFPLSCIGEGFTPDAVIVFNGLDEPTTVVSPTEVTTGVNMPLWAAPVAVPVAVRTSAGLSAPLTFEFTDY